MKAKGKIDPNIIEKLGMSSGMPTGPNTGYARDSMLSGSPGHEENNNKNTRSQNRNISLAPNINTHNLSQPDIPGDYTVSANNRSGPSLQAKKQRRKPRSPRNQKAPSMAGPGYGILKQKKDMEVLRKKCNDELLVVLEEEQLKENERELQI